MIWSANSDYIIIASGLGGIEIVHFHDEDLAKLDFVLAHTSNCHQLKLWEVNDHTSAMPSHRQKALMALGGADFQVTLWDVDDLICHTTICLESEVRGISLSGDGDYLAIVSEDPNISVVSSPRSSW
jgi:WD40 repeat protein